LWDAVSCILLNELLGQTDVIFDLEFSPGGAQLASLSTAGTILFWGLPSTPLN